MRLLCAGHSLKFGHTLTQKPNPMNTQQLARDVKFLKTYTLGTTAALVVLVFCAFSKPEKIMRFGEISVERLNYAHQQQPSHPGAAQVVGWLTPQKQNAPP